MTTFEWAQIGTGAAQALVGAIGIYFLVMNFKSTNLAVQRSAEANALIEKQLDHTVFQQRPWIQIELSVKKCELRDKNIYFLIEAHLKNVGMTAASSVSIRSCILEGFNEKFGDRNIIDVIGSQTSFKHGVDKVVLFPGCSESSFFNLYLPIVEIDNGQKVIQKRKSMPLILIEVTYKSRFSAEDHVTTFNGLFGHFPNYEDSNPIEIGNFDGNLYTGKTGLLDNFVS